MKNVAPIGILTAWLVPAVIGAGPVRVARVGDLDGQVEVQLHAADMWQPATRNMPLLESTWVRTTSGARIELELDDGSALRLVGDALGELSDYTRLSTGQRVTVLSLDHGVAYFTGEPGILDAVILAVPGAQATVRAGTRVRLEARDQASQIAVIEGAVRFSSPSAEMDLSEGQTARVETASQSRFFLYREVTPFASDRWNEQRDKALAATGSGRQVPGLAYGLADLDASGSWIQTDGLGAVWKPKVTADWVPYRDGRWQWYDELGYTWVANEPWGWLPFHYGQWTQQGGLGWVWSPGKRTVFKPGEVYWLKEAGLVGWGPLAPGENWDARSVPLQYLRASTTLAKWTQETRELVPVEADEKLKTTQAVFVVAPPSPAFDAARLDAARPILRAGSTRIMPVLPGVTYATTDMTAAAPPPPDLPPPAEPANTAPQGAPPSSPDYGPAPVPEPVDILYPAAVYTGIVVVNPPERTARGPNSSHSSDSSNAKPPGLGMPRGDGRQPTEPGPVHPVEPAPIHRPEPA